MMRIWLYIWVVEDCPKNSLKNEQTAIKVVRSDRKTNQELPTTIMVPAGIEKPLYTSSCVAICGKPSGATGFHLQFE